MANSAEVTGIVTRRFRLKGKPYAIDDEVTLPRGQFNDFAQAGMVKRKPGKRKAADASEPSGDPVSDLAGDAGGLQNDVSAEPASA